MANKQLNIEALPNTYNFLVKEKLYNDYGDKIFQILLNIYIVLSKDKKLNGWVNCTLNRYTDIYNEFIKMADNLIPLPEDIYEIGPWNVIYYRDNFYDVWTNELLQYIMNNKK